ncbi:hypothetical protein LNTAR_19342 [Lentisphaera araneosa HTCC2155]|uniref:Uncharacterized protein n=1 Tax=Lentisphaera araneosa HTCC2155 TaxID=313628 RepID=A6DQT4_9BACT|nr:ankyrin repeat domain-containing protein [Lentisphaera araneosa]EDM25984.1 hypothetical protein LNTAR_19342 [Lentisphaera araneosa HTCC2155]
MSIQSQIPLISEFIHKGKASKIIELFEENKTLIHQKPAGWSWLHMACEENNLEVVKLLLNYGLNINERDDYSQTPLTRAVSHNQLIIAKYLLDNGADVDAKIDNSKTNIMIAIQEGNLEIVKLLIEYGANLSSSYIRNDNKVITPLILSKEYGWKNIINYIEQQIIKNS